MYTATAKYPFSSHGIERPRIAEELGREPDDPATAFALKRLVDAGYLRTTLESDQHPGPHACELTERGLQVTAG